MAFTQKTLDFLFENRANDSREWFHSHHDDYESAVVIPAKKLVRELSDTVLKIDTQMICDDRVGRCISRLNRDIRFSFNKELYRDVVWVCFMREKHQNFPCLYFEISPGGCNWGCGWYETDKSTVDKMREMILSHSLIWKKAHETLQNHPEYVLEGEEYKRSHFPQADADQLVWLNKKSFCAVCDGNGPEDGFGDDLAERLKKAFIDLKPIYDFFVYAHVYGKK